MSYQVVVGDVLTLARQSRTRVAIAHNINGSGYRADGFSAALTAFGFPAYAQRVASHNRSYATSDTHECPGTYRLEQKDNIVCCHLVAQFDYRSIKALQTQPTPAHLIDALQMVDDQVGNGGETKEDRLRWFQLALRALALDPNLPDDVYVPYGIGCGRAGGDWDDHERALKQFARNANVNVTVVRLPVTPASAFHACLLL